MEGLQMKYFVLKPKGNTPYAKASRSAIKTYANEIRDINPDLEHDLIVWVNKEDKSARLQEFKNSEDIKKV